jgi:hypothetical protein
MNGRFFGTGKKNNDIWNFERLKQLQERMFNTTNKMLTQRWWDDLD